MKVCIITSTGYENSPRCVRIALSLEKHYEVEVVDFLYSRKSNYRTTDRQVLLNKVGPIWWPQINALKLAVFFFTIFPQLIATKADIYYCFGFPSFVIALPLKIGRKKLIYDSYEHYPYQYSGIKANHSILQAIIWTTVDLLEGFFSRFCDYVIVVPSYNDVLYNKFRRYGVKLVSEIWNVPPIGYLYKKEKKRSSDEKQVLLYVGGISEDNGILTILEAISRIYPSFPSLKALLVGPIKMDKNILSKRIEELNIQNIIIIKNQVPYAEISQYYLNGNVGLTLYQPTYWTLRTKASEKLFEYMLFSLPIIVSNFPGLSAIVNECKCGILVDPNNVQEISNAFVSLLSNPPLARELGENGRAMITKKYNWELEEKKLLKIFSEL